MENLKSHIIRFMLLVAGAIALSMPVLLSAQQATDKLPDALGTYLSAMEGLIKCRDITLSHVVPTDKLTFYGYKGGISHAALKYKGDWTVPSVSGQQLSIIVYFTIGTRDPERIRLYRLRTGKDIEPFITPSEEISYTVAPIADVPGAALGNMVRLIPDRVLTKGNYLLVEDAIEKVDRSWGFTIDGGEEMWRTPKFWERCCASLCAML